MPKYEFEGSILRSYSGEVEADSIEEARDIIRADMDWYDEHETWTEIDYLGEVVE